MQGQEMTLLLNDPTTTCATTTVCEFLQAGRAKALLLRGSFETKASGLQSDPGSSRIQPLLAIRECVLIPKGVPPENSVRIERQGLRTSGPGRAPAVGSSPSRNRRARDGNPERDHHLSQSGVPYPRRAGGRDPRSPGTTCCPAALRTAAAAAPTGSDLLDLGTEDLVPLEVRARHRPAGDRESLAPAGLLEMF